MQIISSKNFDKQYSKLNLKIQNKVKERIELFLTNKFDPILNNHKLHGQYSGYNSLNITGDVRVIYREEETVLILMIAVGTHSQLYKN